MSSRSSLVTLPLELLDNIISELHLADVCNLRLSSHALADQVTGTSFTSYYERRTIQLTVDRIAELLASFEQPWIVSALEHLRITAPVSLVNSPSSVASMSSLEVVATLRDVFRAIVKSHGLRVAHLQSLTLEIHNDGEPYGPIMIARKAPEPQKDLVWALARSIAVVVGQAVSDCDLQLIRLDLFGSSQRCALDASCLQDILAHFPRDKIEDLSVAISARPDEEQTQPGTPTQAHLGSAMAGSLSSFVCLQHLDIRYYSLGRLDVSDTELCDRSFLTSIASSPVWQRLTSLSLRGIYASPSNLLQLLQKCTELSILTLEEVYLPDGGFSAITHHIDQQSGLQILYLNDIYDIRLVEFPDAPGPPHFPRQGRNRKPSWMRRMPGDERKPIRYRDISGRQLGSPQFMRWNRQRIALYGPMRGW